LSAQGVISNIVLVHGAQQFMCQRAGATPVEVGGSHAIYVSNPGAVADLIKSAAKSL
jgi:hypothetical protein